MIVKNPVIPSQALNVKHLQDVLLAAEAETSICVLIILYLFVW